MARLDVIALANTFAIIDVILHPLFHIWISVHPASYERAMHLFVAGLELNVTEFDSSISHILMGTALEAAALWCLGAIGSLLYNKLLSHRK